MLMLISRGCGGSLDSVSLTGSLTLIFGSSCGSIGWGASKIVVPFDFTGSLTGFGFVSLGPPPVAGTTRIPSVGSSTT